MDVTHKKRGRPPLKAEEAPLRPYTSPFEDSTTAPRESLQSSPSSSRGHFHRRTSSREIRPITDLQFSRAGDPGRIGSSGLGPAAVVQPPRWSPSMYSPPQTLATSPSMPASLGPRPFSSSGVLQHAVGTQAPSPFIQPSSSAIPTAAPSGGGRSPVEISRPVPPYVGRSLPPAVSPRLYQQPFPAAPSPYINRPRTPNRPAATEPPVSRELQPPYFDSGIRLPPILPPTTTATEYGPIPSAHRRSDPFPTHWSFRERQGHLLEQQQPAPPPPPPPPREPREPVSHQTPPYQRYPPELARPDVTPRQSGPPAPATPIHPSPESPVRTQAGPPRIAATESDDSPRPAKRRRMALDDMVND